MHRRDTPHHLKNKRINQQVDKEKVANIIAQALKKQGEGDSSNDGGSIGSSDRPQWSTNDQAHGSSSVGADGPDGGELIGKLDKS